MSTNEAGIWWNLMGCDRWVWWGSTAVGSAPGEESNCAVSVPPVGRDSGGAWKLWRSFGMSWFRSKWLQYVAVSCCGISPVASCSIVHCLPISQVGTIPKSSQIDSWCHFCFPPVFHSLADSVLPQAGGQQWTCGQGGTSFVPAQRSSVR